MLKVIIENKKNRGMLGDPAKTKVICPRCLSTATTLFFVSNMCPECYAFWPPIQKLLIEYDQTHFFREFRTATIKYHHEEDIKGRKYK